MVGNKMKLCPKCELNYIQDEEDCCVTCLKSELIKKYKTEEYLHNLVAPNEILNRVSATTVFQAIRYLVGDYGEYSIYEKGERWSYRKLLNHLRKNFKYAIIKYPSKAGFAYVFDCGNVWENFFMKEEKIKQVLEYRHISAMDELIYYSTQWRLGK